MWGIQSDECHLDQIVQRVGSPTWLDMGCGPCRTARPPKQEATRPAKIAATGLAAACVRKGIGPMFEGWRVILFFRR